MTKTSKECPGCALIKPRTEFGVDRQKRDGLTARCKSCRSADRAVRPLTPAQRDLARAASLRFRQSEKGKAAAKAYREQTRAQHAVYRATYLAKNPEVNRQYYEANRTGAHLRVLKRRAIKKSATVGKVDLDALWVACAGVCPLCGVDINPTLRSPDPMCRSVDHIVPLSRGGMHEQSNLQWTHLVCNKKKGATVPASTPE